MLMNETIKSILARRSYKAFKPDPIPDNVLDTIVEAGKYAPNGMNQQKWHFTVVKSAAGRAMFKKALQDMMQNRPPFRPAGAGGPPPSPERQGTAGRRYARRACPHYRFRDASVGSSAANCALATENMYIAAASFGVMSGWTNVTAKDLFADPAVKKQFKIPEGYDVYSASFFGYPDGETKDRGPRKAGVTVI